MLRKIFIGTMLMAALMVGVNHAQTNSPDGYYGNTASANISAELSLPISIFSGFGEMHFGGFMPGATEGTVILPADPELNRSVTGGVVLITRYTGMAGRLWVDGDPDATYQLTYTTDPVTLTGGNNATMTLTEISTYTTEGLFKLNSEGFQEVRFGGKLSVGINQEMGSYSGTFQITANYQ